MLHGPIRIERIRIIKISKYLKNSIYIYLILNHGHRQTKSSMEQKHGVPYKMKCIYVSKRISTLPLLSHNPQPFSSREHERRGLQYPKSKERCSFHLKNFSRTKHSRKQVRMASLYRL